MTRDDTCLNCNRTSHWAKDCRLPPRRGGEVHVVQAEGQDHALFLVHGCVELRQQTGEEEQDSSFPLPSSASSTLLHLDEPCAHAFLGTGPGDDKIEGWYLDTGTTHHMTGQRAFFSNLDPGVRGSVKFGDTSAVEIKGVGSIVEDRRAPDANWCLLHPHVKELHHQLGTAR